MKMTFRGILKALRHGNKITLKVTTKLSHEVVIDKNNNLIFKSKPLIKWLYDTLIKDKKYMGVQTVENLLKEACDASSFSLEELKHFYCDAGISLKEFQRIFNTEKENLSFIDYVFISQKNNTILYNISLNSNVYTTKKKRLIELEKIRNWLSEAKKIPIEQIYYAKRIFTKDV